MASMRFSASRMSPVAPYFFLIARISSSRALAEEVLELGVEAVLVLERGVRRAAFVEDLQGRAVVHGVHQLVGVDVLAEALHGALRAVLLGDQRRAGEGDARRVREGLEEIVAEIGALRAVRLVDHQEDALGGVHHAEGLRRRRRAVAGRAPPRPSAAPPPRAP